MATQTLDECFGYLQLLMHKYMIYVNSFRDDPIFSIVRFTEHERSIVFDCTSNIGNPNIGNPVNFTITFHHTLAQRPVQAAGDDFHNIHDSDHGGQGMVGTTTGYIITQVLFLEVNSINQQWSTWVAYGNRALIRALHEQLVHRGFVTNPQGTNAAVNVICR